MSKTCLVIIYLLFFSFAKGQQIDSDTICITDTVLVKGIFTYPKDFQLPDTSNSFLATYCDYRKKIGFRFDFAFSQYFHSNSMNDWIGYHQGTNLNFAFAFENLNIGVRFKPWTTKPKKELEFEGNILLEETDINPMRFDYYLGYEFNLSDKISIEPSIGYTNCKFKLTHEDTVEEEFNFGSTNGLLLGLTINKYIDVYNYHYFVLFGRVNHGFVDYNQIHPELDGGYTEISLGISYKLYWRKRIYNVI